DIPFITAVEGARWALRDSRRLRRWNESGGSRKSSLSSRRRSRTRQPNDLRERLSSCSTAIFRRESTWNRWKDKNKKNSSARTISTQSIELAGEVEPEKPKLRGVLHQVAFFIAIAIAPILIVGAHAGRARAAAAVFAASVVACFGASALYHRVTWTPRMRLWMRRVDHAGVYLLIAGTYTPVTLLVLKGAWRPTILAIVWGGATAAIVL